MGKEYTVIRMCDSMREPQEYTTDTADIREISARFGRCEDTLKLYDGEKLLAIATWFQGYKQYSYCTNPDPDMPNYDVYRA